MGLSVILPTYNERKNLPILVKELISEFKKSNYEYEIIIVDDYSPDGTWEVAQELEREIEEVKLIIRKEERGLASALRVGVENAKKDIICFMDTDLSHPPKDITRMMEHMNSYDSVWASRYVKGGKMIAGGEKRLQWILSKIFNSYLKIFLHLPIADTTNGFFIIRRNIFDLVDLNKVFVGYGDYAFKLLYHLKGKGIKMTEIPFTYEKRRYGESKTHILHIAVKYFIESLKARLIN